MYVSCKHAQDMPKLPFRGGKTRHLLIHTNPVPTLRKKFPFNSPFVLYSKKSPYLSHFQTNDDTSEKKSKCSDELQCKDCDKYFMNRRFLANHIQRRHLASASKVKVTSAKKEGGNQVNLSVKTSVPLELSDLPDISLECTHCDRTFKNRNVLNKHLSSKHSMSLWYMASQVLKCTYPTWNLSNFDFYIEEMKLLLI